MKALSDEIETRAPAERVWAVFSDFDEYEAWNPFITRVDGKAKQGARLRVRIQPPGTNGMTFKPLVTRVDRERQLRWMGRFLLPRLFDGEHIFEIFPVNESLTRLRQRERFTGLLVPPLWSRLAARVQEGFAAMNAALKKRVEEHL